MRLAAVLALPVFLAVSPVAGAAAVDHCVSCHATLDKKHSVVVKDFAGDIHREKGLNCASCHGGDPAQEGPAEAMNPDKGFVGAPAKGDIPRFCGKCHSNPAYMKKFNPSLPVDQELKYSTSMHGRRLKGGDTNVATCAACHTAHSIRPAKDPTSSVYAKNIPQTCGKCHSDAKRMAPYKIPTDQVALYMRSVHGKALLEKGDTAAPVCNTCHGNHGAAPPGAADIGHVCGMCHPHNAELFLTSPMAKPWRGRKYHICATCHTHHGIQPPTTALLSQESGVCLRCHRPASPALRVATAIQAKLQGVEGMYRDAGAAILRAEDKGMDMGVARDAWDAARAAMYQARTAVHAFRVQTVAEAADPGYAAAQKARKAAEAAVRDFRNRRVGLGVASLIITLLVLALYLKARDIGSGGKG